MPLFHELVRQGQYNALCAIAFKVVDDENDPLDIFSHDGSFLKGYGWWVMLVNSRAQAFKLY